MVRNEYNQKLVHLSAEDYNNREARNEALKEQWEWYEKTMQAQVDHMQDDGSFSKHLAKTIKRFVDMVRAVIIALMMLLMNMSSRVRKPTRI